MGPNELQRTFGKYAELRELEGRTMLCIDGTGFDELSDIDDFEFATVVQFNLMVAYLGNHTLPGAGIASAVDQDETTPEASPINDDAVGEREPTEHSDG